MNTSAATAAMAHQAADPTMRGLGPRVASALVLAPVALALAYVGGLAFNLLVLFAAALMAVEWNSLCNRGSRPAAAVILAGAIAAVGAVALGEVEVGLALVLPAVVAAFVAAWLGAGRPVWSAVGVVYIAVPCAAIIWLRAEPSQGLAVILWLLAVVWATDIGAYFAGRGIGGPKLWPRFSPQKTWAGLAGGVLCAAAVGLVAALLLDPPARWPLVVFSAVLALVAQGGDLFESAVKRRFGAKDSGRLIPGHGGVLDRLDGVMTTAPAVAATALVGDGGVWAWR